MLLQVLPDIRYLSECLSSVFLVVRFEKPPKLRQCELPSRWGHEVGSICHLRLGLQELQRRLVILIPVVAACLITLAAACLLELGGFLLPLGVVLVAKPPDAPSVLQ